MLRVQTVHGDQSGQLAAIWGKFTVFLPEKGNLLGINPYERNTETAADVFAIWNKERTTAFLKAAVLD